MVNNIIQFSIDIMWKGIADIVIEYLTDNGMTTKLTGEGLEATISIDYKDKHADYKLYNTLMEIFVIDRDDNPLIFDAKILDEKCLRKKMTDVIASKMKVLLTLLLDDNGLEQVENMKGYERIRVWEIDTKKGGSDVPKR
jgi:hypothetical protein